MHDQEQDHGSLPVNDVAVGLWQGAGCEYPVWHTLARVTAFELLKEAKQFKPSKIAGKYTCPILKTFNRWEWVEAFADPLFAAQAWALLPAPSFAPAPVAVDADADAED